MTAELEAKRAAQDRRDKLLLLTAGVFAVRLFRSPDSRGALHGVSDAEREQHAVLEQADREAEARRAALDAQAILTAVEALT